MTYANLETTATKTKGKAVWSGLALSGLAIAFLTLYGAMKLTPLTVVTETMARLGWPADAATARLLGVLTLGATLLYAAPRTSVLGAILFLRGAFGLTESGKKLPNLNPSEM